MNGTNDDRVPVTVLTGFLGSGKTTLLNRILTEQHGRRIAVIENEFGEVGIDQALVINADEEVFEMNNGCICCTVRGDLIRILGNLMKRRDRFDHVLVETTGLADPGPVAQTFFVDDEVSERFRLDGIVTLVDARHVALHLDDSRECKEQIAFADRVVLNKLDLVTEAEADRVEARVRGINAMASVLRARHAEVPIAAVLDVGGFDLARAVAQKPAFLEPEYPFEWAGVFELAAGRYRLVVGPGPDPSMNVLVRRFEGDRTPEALGDEAEASFKVFSGEGTGVIPGMAVPLGALVTLDLRDEGERRFLVTVREPGRYAFFTEHTPSEFALRLVREDGSTLDPWSSRLFAGAHSHDDTVSSVGIHALGTVNPEAFNAWLGKLLREKGTDIFRTKGILNVAGQDRRWVFQGVHMLLDGRADRPWGDEPRVNDLVFIGRNLDRAALQQGFRACLT
jgi:G3E family GTPase